MLDSINDKKSPHARLPTLRIASPTVLVSESSQTIAALYARCYDIDVRPLFKSVDQIELRRCEACDLRYFSPAISGDEGFYNALQRYDWYYESDKTEFATAVQSINGSRRVLDVGAGRGAFAKHVHDGTEYVGLDFSTQAKSMALQSGIHIRNESVADHSLAEAGQYDAVCSFQVLEHVTDVSGFIRACTDCLKPGGTLLFSVPAEDSFLRREVNGALNLPPHHLTRWTDQCLRNVASLFDLQLVDVISEPVSEQHRLWRQGIEALPRKSERDQLVDLSLAYRLRRALKVRMLRLANAKPTSAAVDSRGHTVTAIYRKP